MSERLPQAGAAGPSDQASGGRSLPPALAAALLFLLPAVALCAIYARALDYDYAWTDTSAIAEATMLRPPGEIALAFREPLHRIPHRGTAARQTYYRPLQVVGLSWVADRFDARPRTFRLAGLLVGALCVGGWALFVWRLSGSRAVGLAAGLFVALHPVGIESYVWIAGISGPLCGLFLIATLALAGEAAARQSRPAAISLALASVVALGAALLSKERALVGPALLLALFASARCGGDAGKAEPARATPDPRWAACLVAVHTAVCAVYFFGWRPMVLGDTHVALAPIGGTTTSQVSSALANWPAVLGWLFLPLHSSTSDVIRVVDTLADPRALLGAGLAVGSAIAWALCLRRGWGLTALGIAWIWIAYLPTAGLVPMLHANGERYVFLSAFGASLLFALPCASLARRAGPLAGAIAALVVLALLAQRTNARIPEWSSNQSLFAAEIARDPAFREGYFIVASELQRAGQLDQAAAHLRTVLAEGPAFAGTASYLNPLSTHELLCSVELERREYAAIVELEQQLTRRQPGLLRAPTLRACIGQAHDALGHTQIALEHYLGVARELKNSAPPVLHIMIARNHLRLGQTRAARPWVVRARASSGADPALGPQVQQLERLLREAEAAARP